MAGEVWLGDKASSRMQDDILRSLEAEVRGGYSQISHVGTFFFFFVTIKNPEFLFCLEIRRSGHPGPYSFMAAISHKHCTKQWLYLQPFTLLFHLPGS